MRVCCSVLYDHMFRVRGVVCDRIQSCMYTYCPSSSFICLSGASVTTPLAFHHFATGQQRGHLEYGMPSLETTLEALSLRPPTQQTFHHGMLPPELWVVIIEHCTRASQRTCLSLSRAFHRRTLPLLFREVIVSFGAWESWVAEEQFDAAEDALPLRQLDEARSERSFNILRRITLDPSRTQSADGSGPRLSLALALSLPPPFRPLSALPLPLRSQARSDCIRLASFLQAQEDQVRWL